MLNDIFEHFKAIVNQDVKVELDNAQIHLEFDGFNTYILPAQKLTKMYHGTSLTNAVNIIKQGKIYPNNNYDSINYNKIYCFPNLQQAKSYTRGHGVIFAINTVDCLLYRYRDDFTAKYLKKIYREKNIIDEYFIYKREIGLDDITSMWLTKDSKIEREISKEELLKLGV